MALLYVNSKASLTMLYIVCDPTQRSKCFKMWVGRVTLKTWIVTVVTFGGWNEEGSKCIYNISFLQKKFIPFFYKGRWMKAGRERVRNENRPKQIGQNSNVCLTLEASLCYFLILICSFLDGCNISEFKRKIDGNVLS